MSAELEIVGPESDEIQGPKQSRRRRKGRKKQNITKLTKPSELSTLELSPKTTCADVVELGKRISKHLAAKRIRAERSCGEYVWGGCHYNACRLCFNVFGKAVSLFVCDDAKPSASTFTCVLHVEGVEGKITCENNPICGNAVFTAIDDAIRIIATGEYQKQVTYLCRNAHASQ
jgi:hypothetical protein